MKGRVYNSVRNVTFNFANQIVSVILKFIIRTVFIRVLSVEYLGVNGLFTDILQLLSLADLGFNTVMTYSLYEPLAKKRFDEVTALINFYKKIYSLIAIAITAIGISLIPFLKYIVNLDSDMPLLHIYYLCFLANTVASYIVAYKTVIITADQKGYLISRYTSIINIGSAVISIFALLLYKNFLLYLIIQVLTTYFTNLFVSYKATKLYPYINGKASLDSDRKKQIFKDVQSAFIYKISGMLITATDNILISMLINTATVGLYSNYSLIVKIGRAHV